MNAETGFLDVQMEKVNTLPLALSHHHQPWPSEHHRQRIKSVKHQVYARIQTMRD